MEIDGKSSIGHCELPTGVMLNGEVVKDVYFREMAGPEEDIFANKKMSISRRLTSVMQNCITKIGVIEDRAEINKFVVNLVGTDRFYLLIQFRILSVDSAFEFKTACPECGVEDSVVFDLNDVGIINPPKASNLFVDVKLPSGNQVRIKVADSKVEEIIEKASNEKNAVSMALFSRVDSFNDRPASLSDIINLSMKDRKKLREAIDGIEGELDDKYKTTCPACGHEYEGHLPMGGADFLGL